MTKDIIADRKSTKNYSPNNLNFLSFFSGAMGLDIGLEKEGFNIQMACEYDKASRNTIVLNDSKIGLIRDIRNYSTEEILDYANLDNRNQVDVIAGGPPCQAFSTAGKRLGFSDERGNVFLKFLEIIEDIQPRYFVLENVRGLMSSIYQIPQLDEISKHIPSSLLKKKGSSLYYTIKRMEQAGYKLNFDLYNAANFGVPQSRERIIIIGTRLANKVNRLLPTHSKDEKHNLPKWRTLKDAFDKKNFKDSEGMKYTERRISFYKHLKAGENWKNLPIELQEQALGKAFFLGGGKTGFLRRLDWDKPSPTIVTNPAMPATDLCHPDEIRPLNVEEYKAIQQFPLSWKFGGTSTDKYRQIGNAVPVGLGRAIGKEIKKHSEGLTDLEIKNFRYSRYRNTSYDDFLNNFENNELTLF